MQHLNVCGPRDYKDLPYNITSKLQFSDPGLGLLKCVLLKVEYWCATG